MQNGSCTSSKYSMGNVQKALQKYVGYSGMDSYYCDRISDLMDRAQNWCLDIEEIYNKAEVHSINTREMLQMLVYSLILLRSQFLSSRNLQSCLIWDGETASRKLTDYTISIYLMRLSLSHIKYF